MKDDDLGLRGIKFKCVNKDHYYGFKMIVGKIYKAQGSHRANDGKCSEPNVDRIYVEGWWVGIKNFELVEEEEGDVWTTP